MIDKLSKEEIKKATELLNERGFPADLLSILNCVMANRLKNSDIDNKYVDRWPGEKEDECLLPRKTSTNR
jgi:hypothetical protein